MIITLQDQKQILKLYKKYKETDPKIIKANIIKLMDDTNIKPSKLSEVTGIQTQTIYQLRKLQTNYIPDFINSLLICDALGFSVTELFKPIKVNIPESNTKWDITAKEIYCKDFENLSVTELIQKYNITKRTAQEYYRNFKSDLEKMI